MSSPRGLASFLAKDRSRSMGYIDTTGTVVISPQFAQAGDFHEGLAAVEVFNAGRGKEDFTKPQQFGFINREGSLAIPAMFRIADRFSEGLAAVPAAEAKEWSYIDTAGQIVIPSIACGLLLTIHGRSGDDSGPRRGRGWVHQSAWRVRLAFAEITKHRRNGLGSLLISMLVACTNPTCCASGDP